jgi:hypothetical protein
LLYWEIVSQYKEIILLYWEIVSQYKEIILLYWEIVSQYKEIILLYWEIVSSYKEMPHFRVFQRDRPGCAQPGIPPDGNWGRKNLPIMTPDAAIFNAVRKRQRTVQSKTLARWRWSLHAAT